MSLLRLTLLLLAASLAWPATSWAAVQLDEMTWTEVREALRAGSTTVIVPIGGTEQNGPHMALGKHNYRVAVLSERIATQLGNALVAPVLAYVPEGRVAPPAGHMRFPGTISVPDDAFSGIVAGAARSLRQHGFRDIVLLGDSGDYQPLLRQLSQRLNRDWAASPARVHHIHAYYLAASTDFPQLLRARGIPEAQIGIHAGLADTSLMMAVDATRVRAQRPASPPPASGVTGDPSQASAALGQQGVDLVVNKTVAAIRQAVAVRP
jgi:creatinine amidohydrolase/Fe(II)-dependent formamide hydrolase-like protein